MSQVKMLENAHKITYLVQQYPDHKLSEITKLLGMPAIEINTGLWYAKDLELIDIPGDDSITYIKSPDNWVFGEQVETLMDMLLYALQKTAETERDMEENYISNWTLGYNPQDVMIAINMLVGNGQLGTYTLADPDDLKSVYTFYTLAANVDKVWGRKSFKKEPVQAKDMPADNEADDTAEETKSE